MKKIFKNKTAYVYETAYVFEGYMDDGQIIRVLYEHEGAKQPSIFVILRDNWNDSYDTYPACGMVWEKDVDRNLSMESILNYVQQETGLKLVLDEELESISSAHLNNDKLQKHFVEDFEKFGLSEALSRNDARRIADRKINLIAYEKKYFLKRNKRN